MLFARTCEASVDARDDASTSVLSRRVDHVSRLSREVDGNSEGLSNKVLDY